MALRPAIGLVIDQQEITMSVVATTLRGRREVARLAITKLIADGRIHPGRCV